MLALTQTGQGLAVLRLELVQGKITGLLTCNIPISPQYCGFNQLAFLDIAFPPGVLIHSTIHNVVKKPTVRAFCMLASIAEMHFQLEMQQAAECLPVICKDPQRHIKLGKVLHACRSNTQDVEAGG